MTDLEARLRRYINRGMYRIPGWLHPVDASLFAATLTYQRSREWRGDVAEIGVYHGRSFCLAGQTLADGEAAVAADLFAEPDQLRRFTGHARRNGIDPRILIGPSDRLTSAELPTPVRFFSVDGGHMYGDVKHDAQLAASALAPHGVIAFDDVMSPEWPETTVAVIDWLRSTRSRYAPFAISQGKLYVCRDDHHQDYLGAIGSSEWMAPYRWKEITLFGTSLMWFHQPIGRRIVAHLRGRMWRF